MPHVVKLGPRILIFGLCLLVGIRKQKQECSGALLCVPQGWGVCGRDMLGGNLQEVC